MKVNSGTATGARFLYRMVPDKTDAEREEAARMLGIKMPQQASYGAKTASKTALKGSPYRVAKHEKRLPTRVVGI